MVCRKLTAAFMCGVACFVFHPLDPAAAMPITFLVEVVPVRDRSAFVIPVQSPGGHNDVLSVSEGSEFGSGAHNDTLSTNEIGGSGPVFSGHNDVLSEYEAPVTNPDEHFSGSDGYSGSPGHDDSLAPPAHTLLDWKKFFEELRVSSGR